eukprot:8939562-Alexandrium_andersonii.AAC.1
MHLLRVQPAGQPEETPRICEEGNVGLINGPPFDRPPSLERSLEKAGRPPKLARLGHGRSGRQCE